MNKCDNCGDTDASLYGCCDKCWNRFREEVSKVLKDYQEAISAGPHDPSEEEFILDDCISSLREVFQGARFVEGGVPELMPVTIEDGCKRCKEKNHVVSIEPGTPQPEPFNPLLDMKFICKGCGLITEYKDAYPTKMSMGSDDNNIVIKELDVLPSEDDLRKMIEGTACVKCGRPTILGICGHCLRGKP